MSKNSSQARPSESSSKKNLGFQEKFRLIEVYFQLGRFNQAEKELADLIEANNFESLNKAEKARVFLKNAQVKERKGNYDQALRNYNKALLNQEKKEEVKKSLISSARLLLKQGEIIQADRIFKNLISIDPEDSDLFYEYAQIKDRQRKYFQAIEFYKKALILKNSYSNDSVFLKKYAQSFTNTRSWITSAMIWNTYLKLQPEDSQAWLILAKVQTRRNKKKLALNAYEKALKLGVDWKEILEKTIWIYDQLEDWKSLEKNSERLIKISQPKNSSYYLLYAKALVNQSRKEEAIEFLLKSQLEIKSLDFYLKSGEFILDCQDYYAASSVYQGALSLYQENLTATLGLANCYRAIGLFEKARDLYQIYLSKVPFNYQARVFLAESLYYSNQERRAIEEYEKVIKDKPSLDEAYYQLGSIFINTDLEKSKQLWKKHLKLNRQSKYKYQIYYYFPGLK